MTDFPQEIEVAARSLAKARSLMISAGAGMGVDSGLPDFRGTEGFWRAYPAFKKLGLRFEELANPFWFDRDPALAWGFYGHRLNLYRQTQPHKGFALLKEWGSQRPSGCFVFTSNVDGQFQRASFDDGRIVECHGSIHHLQCLRGCGIGIFPAHGVPVTIDVETMRACEPLPRCPSCGALARPNILMFGDWGWDSDRTSEQEERLSAWLALAEDPILIIECGAGTSVPTVRFFSERMLQRRGATLVRVNVREPQGPGRAPRFVGIPLGAKEALEAIETAHERLGASRKN